MAILPSIADISQAIQLSIAPVFLLVGIAGFINAFVARLSRVVDRSRVLEELLNGADTEGRETALKELCILDRRARLVYVGITLGITTALLVCILIVTVFLEAFLGVSHAILIGGLFIAAMLSLIGTLVAFLREVFLAVSSLTIGRSKNLAAAPKC
jgi:pheromone shutdown protein TraB